MNYQTNAMGAGVIAAPSNARGPFPRARMAPRLIELWVFTVLLAVLNWPLFCGGNTGLFAFHPEAVGAGEWWRILTHPLVHVSWYHFLLDAAAFLILYHGLRAEKSWQRLGCVVLSAVGSLLVALWVSPGLLATHGLSGLSGVDHGLMLFSLLETVVSRRADLRTRWLAVLGIAAVVGKILFEASTGSAFFASLHLGLLGVPIVACHAGGALAALLFWGFVRSRWGASAGTDSAVVNHPSDYRGFTHPSALHSTRLRNCSSALLSQRATGENVTMKITTDSNSRSGIIRLAGEIDLCCTRELCDMLTAEAALLPSTLIVDLTEVTFMDSSGLSALIGCWRQMQEQGGRLVVVGATGEVLEVFRLTRLDCLISLFPTEPEVWSTCHPVA